LIVIDYAHTPDALEKVLKTLRSHLEGAKNKNKNKKLWVVFGCGGDRDRKKRPQMAKISQKFADRIIVTEDNARFETIENIFEDIFSGFDSKLQKSDELGTWPLLIRHRGEAIRFACELAISQDIVLLAGKGHEKYLEVRGQRIAFDERDFIF